eukprot:Gb_19549 [translate_table: standard]
MQEKSAVNIRSSRSLQQP